MPSRRFSPSLWMVLLLVAAILVPTTLAASRGDKTFSTRNAYNDRRAPKPVSSLNVEAADSASVTLDWSRTWDNVGVEGYGVYLDGTRKSDTASTSFTLTDLVCGKGYTMGVDAFDDAGNRSRVTSTIASTAACKDVTPPSAPVDVRTVASTANQVILAWSPSADDFGVVGYGLYVGGFWVGQWSEPSATITNLSCGQTYQIGIDAADAAGNQSARTDAFFSTAPCTDTTAPSAPAGVSVTKSTQTAVTLGWTASTDPSGIAEYGLYRDSTKVASTSTTSGDVSGLECGKTYTLGVDASDKAQNRSAVSSIAAATAPCTTTTPPPTDTTPSAPPNFHTTSVTQSSVTLAWDSSTAANGIAGYQLFRDGAKIGEGPGVQGGYANEWTDAGRPCGTNYQYAVAGVDSKGNVGAKSTVSVSTSACDAPPPPADTTPPPPTGTTPTTISAPANLRTTSVTQTSVALAWDDNKTADGTTGYRVSRDGTKLGDGPGSYGGYTNTWNDSGRSCGTKYVYSVVGVDGSGNVGPAATLSVTTAACDATTTPPSSSSPPPSTTDTTAPTKPASVTASTRTATSIALTWQPSTDDVGVTGYGLYRGGSRVATATTTTWIFGGLTCNTSYTLGVDAVDAQGNRSAQAVVMVSTTACPDTQPPSTPTGVNASSLTQTGAVLSWTPATDNVGVTGYDVYRNGTKVTSTTTSSSPQSGLTCGTNYTFGVVAYDAAGNRSSQAQTTARTSDCTTTTSLPSGVLEFSGTVSASQFTSQINAAPSGPLTVRPAAGQSSFSVSGDFTLTRQNVTIQHAVMRDVGWVTAAGSGFIIEDSSMHSVLIDGADNWILRRDTVAFSGVSYNGFGGSIMNGASNWQILDSSFTGAYVAADPSQHTEAWFIGAGNDRGLIQGNRFDDNGTTGHIFFSYWDFNGHGGGYPTNICVTGNTFTRSHNPYQQMDKRAELDGTTNNIDINPSNTTDGPPLIADKTWIRPC